MGKKQHSGVLNYGWKYMVDNLEYFSVRDRKIANVWSSYGLELDDRWLGGGRFQGKRKAKSYGLEQL